MSVVSLSAGRALNVINKMQQVHSSSIEAYICIGDFVQVNVFGDGDKFVGQVVDVALSYSDVPPREREDIEPVENEPLILVRLWELVTGATRSIGRLSNEDELVTRGLKEVMESDAGYWTSPHEVTSIAFVCHIDDIKNDRFGCLNGIFNVFFVRYSCVSGTPVLMSSTFNQFDHLKSCILIASVFFRQRLTYAINLEKSFIAKNKPKAIALFYAQFKFFLSIGIIY